MPVRLTLRPAPDEMLTMEPARAAFIAGMTARVQRNALVRLASTIARQSSSLTWSRGLPTWPTTPPALLTRMSTRPSRAMSFATCAESERSAVSRSTRWTVAPSSSNPFAIAVPIPCAVPVTRATLPLSSPILVPPVLDQVANLRDTGPPELEYLVVRSLVGAAEASVDREAAELRGRRLPDDGLRDERLHAFRHGHALKTRPREVLHPRSMRGLFLVALDDRPGAGRVPPVVEEHLHPLLARLGQPLAHHAGRERVSAVAVDHRDASEALAEERVKQIADHGDVGRGSERRTAGERREVRCHAERQRGQYRHTERLRRLDRHALREDRVGPYGEIAVLFGGSDRQHDPVVALEVLLEHLPVAVMDSHAHLPVARRITRDSLRPESARRGVLTRGSGYGVGSPVTAT